MSWLANLLPKKIRSDTMKKINMPEGIWSNCAGCKSVQYREEFIKSLFVCNKCGYHTRLGARQRLEILFDTGSMHEVVNDLVNHDPLKFKDSKKYKDRLLAAQKQTGEQDALIVTEGLINDLPVVVAVFDFSFMGGSMGSAVGEMFARGVRLAIKRNIPFIVFTASGGARMQEGLFSLFQMAKTSAVLRQLSNKGLPFISVLTDPTMGGVSASLAMLGDIIIAEPKALIGFAGPRVIEQTVRQKLPEGFQRSEFLLEKGHIDMVIDRRELKSKLSLLIKQLMNTNSNYA